MQLQDQDIRLLQACYDTYWDSKGQVACLLRGAQRRLTENKTGSLSELLDVNSAHIQQVLRDLQRGTQHGQLVYSSSEQDQHLSPDSFVRHEQPLLPQYLTSLHAFRPPNGGSSSDPGAALVLSHPSGVQAGQNTGGNGAATHGDGTGETLPPEDAIRQHAPYLP